VTLTESEAASSSAMARAASAARLGWIIGPGSRSRRGSRLASHFPSARLCALSAVLRAGDPGQHQPPERPFAVSPSTLAFGVASLPTSYDMPTPSRWPARASRSTSYIGSSAMRPRDHLGLPARHRQQRDHRHGAPPSGPGIAGKRRTSLARLVRSGSVLTGAREMIAGGFTAGRERRGMQGRFMIQVTGRGAL
jgi:hypothetical protein